MKHLKALLMDHDGTLVDSEHAHYRMWLDILSPFGLDLPLEDYVKYHAGRSTTSNAVRLREDNPSLTGCRSRNSSTAKDRAVEEFLVNEAFPLMPGGRAIIDDFVNRGAKAAVVTGADGAGIHVSVRWHGLEELMSTIVSGDQVENGKPAPDGYLLATERLGVEPGRVRRGGRYRSWRRIPRLQRRRRMHCCAIGDVHARMTSAARTRSSRISPRRREWISSNFRDRRLTKGQCNR